MIKKVTLVEKVSHKEAFRRMSLLEKIDYILTYYKIPVVLGTLALIITISGIYRMITRREVVLYCGLVNVETGSEVDYNLTDGFLEANDIPVKKNMVEMYRGLYLTDNPASEIFQYVYASRLKILASIESHQLDVVLLNREAYDAFSQSGYLLPLDTYFDESEGLTINMVVYEDNAEEHAMDPSVPYEAVTGEEPNGLDCSGFRFYQDAGFTEPLYLGVIANTDRPDMAINYLQYLH